MCALCGISLGACAKKSELQFKELSVEYKTGSNIDCYDFIERKQGVEYSFTVDSPKGESIAVIGQTFYAAEAGRYTLNCKARSGKKETSGSIGFDVKDEVPYLGFIAVTTVDVDLRLTVPMIISRVKPLIVSGTETQEYFSRFSVKTKDGLIHSYEYGENNKYVDGNYFTFSDEGEYTFRLVSENSGGKTETDIKIIAKVNFAYLDTIPNARIEYDEKTTLAYWTPVAGAEKYLVRLSDSTVDVYGTSIVIKDFTKPFEYFALQIVPVDANGNKMGRIVRDEEILIAPDGYDGVILGGDAEITAEHRVKMTTEQVYSRSVGEIDAGEKSYVAFKGDYGARTYVDFTFTGNNMPTVRFYANRINGYYSHNANAITKGNRGLLLMSGIVTSEPNKDHTSERADYRIYGPDIMHGSYLGGNHIDAYTYDTHPYLTQKGLSEAEETEFKYTVGTYIDGRSFIRLHIILYKKSGADWKKLYDEKFNTGIKSNELESGGIIALSPLKGNGEAEFSFSQPYNYDAPGTSDPDGMSSYNAAYNDDGTVTLVTQSVYNYNAGNLNINETGYVSFSQKYGVGYYTDFTFTGNDMPIVRLFADEENGKLSNYDIDLSQRDDSKGFILINGLVTSGRTDGHPSVTDEYRIYGPDMIPSYNKGHAPIATYTYDELPYFTQKGLAEAENTEFKYTVGSYANAENEIYVHALLYKKIAGGWEKIGQVKTATGVKTGEIQDGYIIALAPVKGKGKATFGYRKPYEWIAPGTTDPAGMTSRGVMYNDDNTVTMKTYAAYNLNIGYLASINNNYIAFNNDYGVGTYVDFTFTGNNMPIVRLFANTLNGNVTNYVMNAEGTNGARDETIRGVLLINGVTLSGAFNDPNGDHVSQHEDYRIYANKCINAGYVDKTVPLNRSIYSDTPYLTQKGLSEAADTKFKYTVGTYSDSGKITLHVILYKEVGGNWQQLSEINCKTNFTSSDLPNGKIIAMGSMKGKGETTFGYSMPYIKSAS